MGTTAHPPPSSLTPPPVPYGPPRCVLSRRVSVIAVAVPLCQGCAVVVGDDGDGLWQFKIRREYATCFKIHVFVQLEQSFKFQLPSLPSQPIDASTMTPTPSTMRRHTIAIASNNGGCAVPQKA